MKNHGCRKLVAKHLTLGLDSGKAELFQEAFADVVESQGGLKKIARRARMPVRLVEKTLADRWAFQFWVDVAKILKGLGGKRLEFKPTGRQRKSVNV